MPHGKLAAQAGHAFTNTLLTSFLKNPESAITYETPGQIGTKICLKAENLDHLTSLYEKTQAFGYPCQLITDEGHIMPPHFTGEPIITALGIGPITKDEAKPILGKLRLVQ